MSPPPRGLSPARSMGRSPSRLGGFDRGPPEGSGPPGRLGQSCLGPPGPAPGRHERTVWIGQVPCHLCYRDTTALPFCCAQSIADFADPFCDDCTAYACADKSLVPSVGCDVSLVTRVIDLVRSICTAKHIVQRHDGTELGHSLILTQQV